MADSVNGTIEEKNKRWWAVRFYDSYYADKEASSLNLQEEVASFRQGFESWHKQLLDGFALQGDLGEEMTIAKDLTFQDVAEYPQVEIDGIDQKIVAAAGDNEAINQLNLQKDRWVLRNEVAKKALSIS